MDQQNDNKDVIMQSEIVAVGQSTSFAGPLPHPDLFRGYEETLPGAADRILKMAEREQEERLRNNAALIDTERKERRRGQYLGCGLSALFATFAFVLGYLGHEWLAGVIFASAVISIAIVFVLNKIPQKDDNNTP